MIRSIEKLKVRIDQNLNRAEKSEALSGPEVVKVDLKVTTLKQVFHPFDFKQTIVEAPLTSAISSCEIDKDYFKHKHRSM